MKHVENTIRYALSKYCTVTRNGRTNHVSMSIPPERLQQMLVFMLNSGMQQDQLADTFKKQQKEAMNLASATARAGKSNWSLWVFVVLILGMGAALVFVSELPMWALLIALLIVIPIIWLIFSPRLRAINECWEAESDKEDISDALKTISELYQTSQWKIAMEKYRDTTIAIVAVLAIAFAGIAGIAAEAEIRAAQYHAAFSEGVDLFSMTGSTGTRYVVYDEDAGRFIDADYLPADLKAASAADVAAVLTVDIEKRIVGTYTSGGNAYQQVYTLSLQSCVDGTNYGSLKVYGGDPPETITTRRFSTGQSATGSRPSDEKLQAACEQLIALFESGR